MNSHTLIANMTEMALPLKEGARTEFRQVHPASKKVPWQEPCCPPKLSEVSVQTKLHDSHNAALRGPSWTQICIFFNACMIAGRTGGEEKEAASSQEVRRLEGRWFCGGGKNMIMGEHACSLPTFTPFGAFWGELREGQFNSAEHELGATVVRFTHIWISQTSCPSS